MIRPKAFLWAFAASFLAVVNAFASTGELYGFGARSSAMGNTMLGGASDPFTTFYNPAANSTHPGLQISVGTAYAHPDFLPIENVTIANNATTAKQGDVVGNVDTGNYLDHLQQMVAASMNFGERFKHLTVGVMASLPLARVAYLDTGDTFLPEYVSYRSRTQRPQIFASSSATPLNNLHLAIGLAFSTNLSASTKVFLTGDQLSVSHQQFASTIKPGVAPYFSLYADPKPFEVGLTVRMPNKWKVEIDTTANARLLGPTNDLPLNVNSSSSIYYDPLEFDLALGYQLTPELFATAEADWIQYRAFEAPTLTVTDLGSGPRLRNSLDTTPALTNIIIPKAGLQYALEKLTLRAGYMYRPSPVKDNRGPGNMVDPARHSLTAGLGMNLKDAKVTEKEIFLDLNAQFHYLVRTHVDKSPNNEVGTSGQSKVGAPGYDIGGYIYGGGLSVGMAF